MLKIGNAIIHQVEESVQPSFVPKLLFPDSTDEALAEHLSWMAPLHYDLAEGNSARRSEAFWSRPVATTC